MKKIKEEIDEEFLKINLHIQFEDLLEKLKEFVNKSKLNYSNLGHAYLEISRVTLDLLSQFRGKLASLEEGYDDLLLFLRCFQYKDTNDENEDDKVIVWNNWDRAVNCLNIYRNEISYLREKKFKKFNRCLGIITVIISVIAMILSSYLYLI